MARKVYHVVRGAEGWEVRDGGAARVEGRDFSTKDEAVEAARSVAKQEKPSQVVVHLESGTIETEYTYGDDPRRHPG